MSIVHATTEMKQCTACHAYLPVTHEFFHRSKNLKSGLHNQCRNCRNKAARKYIATNNKDINERKKARYYANREKVLKKNQEYYARNREKIIKRKVIYQSSNKEIMSAIRARKRARKTHSPTNNLTSNQWKTIKAHYGYRCIYCGKKPRILTQDHLTPLSHGGEHTYTNIVPACQSCNSKKGTKNVFKPVQPLLLL